MAREKADWDELDINKATDNNKFGDLEFQSQGSEIVATSSSSSFSSSLNLDEAAVTETEVLDELQEKKDECKNKVVGCSPCGKTFVNKYVLKNHIKKIHESISSTCSICHKEYKSLYHHIRFTHDKIQKKKDPCKSKVVGCSQCGKQIVDKYVLKNHIKKIHNGITSTCPICHKEFKALYSHLRFTHDKIKNYEFSYCKKKFLGHRPLTKHVQSVHLEEKTNCPECKKSFSFNYLRTHIKEFHKGIKKPCPQCGKEFGISNQPRHIRQVHNNESTKCPDCGKAITISNLNKHINSVHNQVKKFCDLCKKEFAYSSFWLHNKRMHKFGMPVDYVTTKCSKPKLKKGNQEEVDQIMKEEINPWGVKEEVNEDIDGKDIEEIETTPLAVKEEGNEDIDEEDIEELELVDPTIEVTKEEYRLEKQGSQRWTWSEPFTFT